MTTPEPERDRDRFVPGPAAAPTDPGWAPPSAPWRTVEPVGSPPPPGSQVPWPAIAPGPQAPWGAFAPGPQAPWPAIAPGPQAPWGAFAPGPQAPWGAFAPGPQAPWPAIAPGPGIDRPTPGRGMPGWAIALVAVAGSFLAVGILAAIALPVFLDQREAAGGTTAAGPAPGPSEGPAEPEDSAHARAVHAATQVFVTAPVAGLEQSDPWVSRDELHAGVAWMNSCGCMDAAFGSAYQDPSGVHSVVVYGGKFREPLLGDDQDEFMDALWAGAHESGRPAVGPEVSRDPGALGGRMRCAPTVDPATPGQLCVSVDAAAVVVVIDVRHDGSPVDPDFAVTARESFEHRG